jgi:hypothetical protein
VSVRKRVLSGLSDCESSGALSIEESLNFGFY